MAIFVKRSRLDLCVTVTTFYTICIPSSEVTMISPSKGSLAGGTTLTVHGRFFDQTDLPARVLVGGIFLILFFLLYYFIRSNPACSLGLCVESYLLTIVIIYLVPGIFTKYLALGVNILPTP